MRVGRASNRQTLVWSTREGGVGTDGEFRLPGMLFLIFYFTVICLSFIDFSNTCFLFLTTKTSRPWLGGLDGKLTDRLGFSEKLCDIAGSLVGAVPS